MKYTNTDIMEKLQKFHELERRKQQLEFELDHYIDMVSGDDIIETQTFKSGIAEYVSSGQTSDITANLALSYADKAQQLNIREKQVLQDALKLVDMEIKRIIYYVNLLDSDKADVVSSHYFERLSITQTAEKHGISIATVKRTLASAAKKLAEMYNLITS